MLDDLAQFVKQMFKRQFISRSHLGERTKFVQVAAYAIGFDFEKNPRRLWIVFTTCAVVQRASRAESIFPLLLKTP